MIANRIRMKSNVPEGGFQPGDLSFIDLLSDGAISNEEISPKTGPLYIEYIPIYIDSVTYIDFYQNGVIVASFDLSAPSPTLQWTIDINSGDLLYFELGKNGPSFTYDEGSVEIRNENSTGVLIDSFNVSSVT